MIDEFISTVYENQQKEERTTKLAAAMEALPTGELKKIARFGLVDPMGGPGESWIDKYKNTPLFEQAMQLEQQYLQLEMQQNEADNLRQQSWSANDQLRAAQDALCVQKRMLDLQLATHEHQSGAEEEMGEEVEEEVEEPVEEAEAQPPPGAEPAAEPAGGPAPTEEAIKQAARAMRVRRILQQKEAGVGGLLRGAKNVFQLGAKKGLSRGAAKAGYKASGPGAGAGLRNLAYYGGALAKKNPAAAAGVAAGAAGAAGLGAGYVAGRS